MNRRAASIRSRRKPLSSTLKSKLQEPSGFFHCLAVVLAVGGDAGQIDKLDHHAAMASGRESRGIGKCGHDFRLLWVMRIDL